MSTRKDQLLRRMSGQKGRNVALTREEKALRDVAEKMPTKLSDLENDLWYSKEILVGEFTMNDWTIDDDDGNAVYEFTPQIEGLTAKNLRVKAFGAVDDVSFAQEYSTNENCDVYTYGPYAYFEAWWRDIAVMHGCIYDAEAENTIAHDATRVIVYEIKGIPFESFTVQLYAVDEKKIPIEYCDTSEIEAEIDALNGEVV